mmetsp:Transcript_21860/g.36575  ORF Transcript_21860/g.36575 Transcript_21860/m.36575 type:complete len:313 (-) Transcript_21860:71-1009(-)|eukprot:CAMPEP_0174960772 /NCGR_PEP_ID=MMETSP0004_2-20121128/3880_1 /TAXON_ID=420556 /ORGANISM="Ochromonas sp., Strain CCMP1393" /LENGTH=312 /DNA_ID=CAMNT_0016209163 /DNA_START=177 /DNA_END=1115 /DNA_ORIENTATION=-
MKFLRLMGFCGVDDSVAPELLKILSDRYEWIEWGVLFRSDLEGTARYPTWSWVDKLSQLCIGDSRVHSALKAPVSMHLAGHLCADRCQEVLAGNTTFIQRLFDAGFRRVQINATAANSVNVDAACIDEYVSNIQHCMMTLPHMEFIIQCNEETKPIYEPLLRNPAPNMSILWDASCGKGVRVNNFPPPSLYPNIPCGYAGGIGPDCILDILTAVQHVAQDDPKNADVVEKYRLWIDMESSLRTIVVQQRKMIKQSTMDDSCGGENNGTVGINSASADGKRAVVEDRTDVFSIDKCFACILTGCSRSEFGLNY